MNKNHGFDRPRVLFVSYYVAKVRYNLRLMVDAGLREHVLRQSYFDDQPNECSGQLIR